MKLKSNGFLSLSPLERKLLNKFEPATRDLIIRSVKASIVRSILYDMSVDDDGRVIFTPKTLDNESKIEDSPCDTE